MVLESLGYGLIGLIVRPVLAAMLAFGVGCVSGFVTISVTTILQISTPGEIRGRIFGLLGTIAGAITPISMGLSGIVADLVDRNVPLIYMTCGGMMTLLSLLVSFRPGFRDFLSFEPEGGPPEGIRESIVSLD
jgi:MFS transporter, DHA3 family, macrolide efflux protein